MKLKYLPLSSAILVTLTDVSVSAILSGSSSKSNKKSKSSKAKPTPFCTADPVPCPDPATCTPGRLYTTEDFRQEFVYLDVLDVTSDSNVTAISPSQNLTAFANAGCVGSPADNFLYRLLSDNQFTKICKSTGDIIEFLPPPIPEGGTWVALDRDPSTGTLYGLSAKCVKTSWLHTIDPCTGNTTLISELSALPCAIGMAIDGGGNAFIYDIHKNIFFSVDLATGATTEIGYIGFDANFGQDMAWDPSTDTIFMNAFNSYRYRSELRIVNTTTGQTTFIGRMQRSDGSSPAQFGWGAFDNCNGGENILKFDPFVEELFAPQENSTRTTEPLALFEEAQSGPVP